MDHNIKGQAITVLGPVPAGELGFTLPHEHLIVDQTVYFREPEAGTERLYAHQPLSLENMFWVKYHIKDHLDVQRLLDEETAIKELRRYKSAGGSTLVEVTSQGLGRDPLALTRIARSTGVHVIMGSGYYVGPSHPPRVARMSTEEIAREIVSDIRIGVGSSGIRAGIIGEIGCSWPLTEAEKKVIRAAALAQRETGAAINIHPSRNEQGPLEVIDILGRSGARLDKVVISHMDRCGYLLENRLKMLDAGCFVEYDLFGKDGYYPAEPALAEGHLPDMLNDVGRIKEVADLIDRGYLGQILVSHDTGLKLDLTCWGGPGYAHLLENAIPRMRIYGYTEAQIQTLTVENPGKMLAIP